MAAILPVRQSARAIGTEILLAAGPDGGLYVTVPDRRGVVLTLLGEDGGTRPGWPIRLSSAYCIKLFAADDGSVRAVCDPPTQGDGLQVPMTRLFAFDRAARSLPNWPIDVEAFNTARILGNDLVLLSVPYGGDTPPAGVIETVHVVEVSAAGLVRNGEDVPLFASGANALHIGPGGTGYMSATRYDDDATKTDIRAFDASGALAGWPIEIDGAISPLAFDGEGRAYVFVLTSDSETRTAVLDIDGGVVGGTTESLPWSTNPWVGANDGAPGPLVVADDGTSFIVSREDGTTILAHDAASRPLPGWPYRSDAAIQLTGFCGVGDTGCGHSSATPVIGSGTTLYVSLTGASASGGGRILALDRNGRVKEGWPLNIRRAGSMVWQVLAGQSGIWALVIEREASGSSATILSVADDSTVRWATTIIDP